MTFEIRAYGLSPLSVAGLEAWLPGWRVTSKGKITPGADVYVVSPEVFAANLEFFIARKKSTLIYQGEDVDQTIQNIKSLTNANKSNATYESKQLSQREIDVLREIARGKTNKEIGEELCISVNTVITHRKNLSGKLGIKSASGLSVYALMNGII